MAAVAAVKVEVRGSAAAGSDSPVPSLPTSEASADDHEPKRHRGDLCHRTVLDPRTNGCVAYWDLVATFALVYTAVVTPFEVAFLQPVPTAERATNGLFWVNRAVDAIFKA